ncbi:MAG: TlpA family protein disulfide reductase [Lunatimonas sp.]|uniref:TlpA family protein disulfide reductase n=1 Tax=Lunatimonas sp. TaxID=2060141 RepID=UPI00263B24B6|nr:TlpA disulfide reductase family protein [Lunatimonas sp.]MCC5936312.1 TlpA family protein disulfide reductase [Lunatimonas sp.]
MDWKKEAKSWGIVLGTFALLYFTGLITPIMGGLQSLILSTGLKKPKVTLENKEQQSFDFSGQFLDTDGDRVGLSQYRGKTLFINLWATWCPPCRAEMPHISELYKKVSGDDVAFLMIALDDDFEKSKKFVSEKGYAFPIVHAAYGLNPSLTSQAIPTTLVVSPEGKVVFYQEGMSNFDTKEFRDFLTGKFE